MCPVQSVTYLSGRSPRFPSEGTMNSTLAAPGYLRGTYDFRILIVPERGIWAARKVSP
jgi:hypothetical protein